ncbi:MAG: NADH-quinone oxidoreductase subunit NuoG [Acidobacteria bacterium]|nr:MAG: NADH-quinone oxidoreductase subunit NuoG [Acidobacteriota bacterium]
MAKIWVDDNWYEVRPDQSLLQVCLELGFDLPYFCWHPALGSVGACRQCAVKQFKDENDTQGRLVMSCMTPATEGTRISIKNPDAVAFRAGVIEGLMMNHPHDCPVCDEGGHCHLQDMTVMTGHNYRRYRYNKRTFRNQYLGPLLNHEMNRCIQCYRCVRYYQDYAGGNDLQAFVLRDIVFFGRHEDGVLQNEFAGNLDEVCPTGVFTDKTVKGHYTRKWDLQMSPSVCVHCGVGCSTSAGERYGMLRRIVNRYNGEVNGYFLCDRGRFGYEFVNSGQRVRQTLSRQDGKLKAVPKARAIEQLGDILKGNSKAIGIGSSRASLESNFALRTLVGPGRFFNGMSDESSCLVSLMAEIMLQGPARSPSLREIEQSDAIFVIGEDVNNTAPRVALALRQAVRQQPMETTDKIKIPRWLDHAVREAAQHDTGPLFIATPNATRLDDVAADTYRAAPVDIARLGFAVAHALDFEAPSTPELPEDAQRLAERIAQALKAAKRPLIIAGSSLNSEAVIQAAANVARALAKGGKAAALSFTMPEANSLGVALLGGENLSAAFKAVEEGKADTVIILENDLYRRAPARLVDNLMQAVRHMIVLDHLVTPTSSKAEFVLPAGAFAESDGTFVNNEGRAQRFFQAYLPKDDIQESWRWLIDLMKAAGSAAASSWNLLDDLVSATAGAVPALAKITEAAPSSKFRIVNEKVPRSPLRYSGRTAMVANISVSEPKPPQDPDSALAFSMEGTPTQPPGSLTPFFWSPGWNSIQSVNKFQSEINGALRGGDPGVRLIEPPQGGSALYFSGPQKAYQARAEEWLLVPLYHVFGSEELSAQAPSITQLAPKPYVALNPTDAERLQVGEGVQVELSLAGTVQKLPVVVQADLPNGIAGLPAGLVLTEGAGLPAWSRISRS